MRRNASVKLGTEKFFLNNEMHETTRKNFMEAALTAKIRRYFHEIFSCYYRPKSCFQKDFSETNPSG